MAEKNDYSNSRRNPRKKRLLSLRKRNNTGAPPVEGCHQIDNVNRQTNMDPPSGGGGGGSVSKAAPGKSKEPSNVVKVKPFVKLPHWNSGSINSKLRLTSSRRIGLFNNGCKSALVRIQKIRPMTEETQARAASDLQRILSLARKPLTVSPMRLEVEEVEPMDVEPNPRWVEMESTENEDDDCCQKFPAPAPTLWTMKEDNSQERPKETGQPKELPGRPSGQLKARDLKEKLDALYLEIIRKTPGIPDLRQEKLNTLKALFAKRDFHLNAECGSAFIVSQKHGPPCSQDARPSRSSVSCRMLSGPAPRPSQEGQTTLENSFPEVDLDRPGPSSSSSSAWPFSAQGEFLWMEGQRQSQQLSSSSPDALDLLKIAGIVNPDPISPYQGKTGSRTISPIFEEYRVDRPSIPFGSGSASTKPRLQVEPLFHLGGPSQKKNDSIRDWTGDVSDVTSLWVPGRESRRKAAGSSHTFSRTSKSKDQSLPEEFRQSRDEIFDLGMKGDVSPATTHRIRYGMEESVPDPRRRHVWEQSSGTDDLIADSWWCKHGLPTLRYGHPDFSPWVSQPVVSPPRQPSSPEDQWKPRARKMF